MWCHEFGWDVVFNQEDSILCVTAERYFAKILVEKLSSLGFLKIDVLPCEDFPGCILVFQRIMSNATSQMTNADQKRA